LGVLDWGGTEHGRRDIREPCACPGPGAYDLDSEFARANRLDEKARGQATLAGSWFAVTQAVAAIAAGPGAEKGWLIALSIVLGLQAISLFVLMVYAGKVWKQRERKEVGKETLDPMKDSISEPDFMERTVNFFTDTLDEAQEANKKRGKDFGCAYWWWWPVLVLGLVEIAAALVSRIP
jgi:hypothetical protein